MEEGELRAWVPDNPEIPSWLPERLRAESLPGLSGLSRGDPDQHEVVHAVATYELLGRWWREEERLFEDLAEATTRLVVLQVLDEEEVSQARSTAEQIVLRGGPPVAVVRETADHEALSRYFDRLVDELVHSRPISVLVEPEEPDAVDVDLFLGDGADDLLRFEPWLEALREEVEETAARVEESAASLAEARRLLAGTVGGEQAASMSERRMTRILDRYHGVLGELEGARGTLREAAERAPWNRESEGAIPVVETVERLERVRREAEGAARELERQNEWVSEPYEPSMDESWFDGRYVRLEPSSPSSPPRRRLSTREPAARAAMAAAHLREHLRDQARAAAERAPRVLNAGFRGAGARRPLAAGRRHVFEVEIGPKRTSEDNRASGDVEFPVQELPPRPGGHVLDVVLVSESLRPRLASGRMWLPAAGGRSAPIGVGGELDAPGPLELEVEVAVPPESDLAAEDADGLLPLGGRLAIYFENNLLQSAALRYWIAAPDAADRKTPEPNDVRVDFVLSGGFQEVEERFGRRRLRLPGDAEPGEHRPAVNLALNDDGAGGHRILVKHGTGETAPPPGWTPYDPDAGRDLLRDTRRSLEECFLDPDDGSIALDAENGKAKKPFLRDLVRLARVGDRLRNLAFANVRGRPGQVAAEWLGELLADLAASRVIQVARTGPANYVFPWALVYDHPLLDRSSEKLCKVTGEWSDDGRRRGPLRDRCPYADEEWHREDVFCPYGFWGLKHVVEQPPSSLTETEGEWRVVDAVREVPTGRVPKIGVAVTDALAPAALARRDRHLASLGASGRLAPTPADPAVEAGAVREMLAGAELVYFLCHGEYDREGKEVYLGIGPRDDRPGSKHRVYPSQVQGWAQTSVPPNLRRWRDGRPLVVVNGCHTADAEPGELLGFVTAFTFAGASGVVGTEVAVLVEVAAEVAEELFERLAAPDPVPVGQAIHEVRWHLADKGNLVGLAYTPYCRADLHLAPART